MSINELSRLHAELESAGVAITDLTSTNPTAHGLFDATLLDIIAASTSSANRYDPNPRGPIASREALAERFGGQPDDYWLTASTSEAYNWLFTLLCDPQDAVAIPTPGYPLIEPLAELASVNVRTYRAHYLPGWGWEYDFGSIAAALAEPTTKALVAVNPNNPTGAYLDADAAARIVQLCARNGTALIADEVFYPFQIAPATLDPGAKLDLAAPHDPGTKRDLAAPCHHPSDAPARLAGTESCLTFALDGLSKLLAAPQLKLGWIRLSGPAALRQEAASALDALADAYLAVSQPVASALPQLLQHADASIERISQRINTNFSVLTSCFADDGFTVRATQGGWMALVDVPKTDEHADPALRALHDGHLYVHPGWFYDMDSENTLALSLLPDPAAFLDAAARLKEVLRAQ